MADNSPSVHPPDAFEPRVTRPRVVNGDFPVSSWAARAGSPRDVPPWRVATPVANEDGERRLAAGRDVVGVDRERGRRVTPLEAS